MTWLPGSRECRIFHRCEFVASEREIGRANRLGRGADGADIFRPTFPARWPSGDPAAVQILLDGRRSNAAQIVDGYATEIVARYNYELTSHRPGVTAASRGRAAHLVQSQSANHLEFRPLPGRHSDDADGTGRHGIVGCPRTRTGHFRTTPGFAAQPAGNHHRQDLARLIGRPGPGDRDGAGGGLYSRVPFTGSILLFYVAMVVYLFAVIGVGLFVSSLAKTQQQAILGTFDVHGSLDDAVGLRQPDREHALWLQNATRANPIRYYIVIVKGLFLKDLPADLVLANLWPMAIIAVITLAAAAWLFRHRLE